MAKGKKKTQVVYGEDAGIIIIRNEIQIKI